MKHLAALDLYRVWVNPSHTVKSARALMREHRISWLPVVDGAYLMGMIGVDRLSGLDDKSEIEAFMQRPQLVLEADQTARDAATRLMQFELDLAPVVQDGRFLGLLTSTMLLGELTQSYDPMTGLSWQDALRNWGVQTLRSGREITILFIDLDDFGAYNKRYGHTVGDKVIRKVAALLKSNLSAGLDILVRYGGDEFAIGTTRSRTEAERLGASLLESQEELRIEESDRPVTFSLGLFGGKRTGWREEDHLEATVDNLINLASKAALEQKRAKKATQEAKVGGSASESGRAEEPKPAPAENPVAAQGTTIRASRESLQVEDVQVDEDVAQTIVTLRGPDSLHHGVQARGEVPGHSVAVATLRAIEEANPNLTFRVLNVQHLDTEHTAEVSLEVWEGKVCRQVSGKAIGSAEKPFWEVANATLKAFESALIAS